MKRLLVILILSFYSCGPQYSGKAPPKVINGEIDLTGWDFEKDGPVKLDGDWLFAWEKFVEPASWDELSLELSTKVKVPSAWKEDSKLKSGNLNQSGIGFSSYALLLTSIPNENLSISAKGIFCAAKIFIMSKSGHIQEMVENGQVAQFAKAEISVIHNNIIAKFSNKKPEKKVSKHNVILLHTSCHFNSAGGLLEAPQLGLTQSMERDKNRTSHTQSIIMGIFMVMFFYHLLLFKQRRLDKSSGYFSVLCMLVSLRQFSMGVAQDLEYSLSIQSFQILNQIEYLSMPSMVLICSLFVESLVPSNKLKKINHLLIYTLALPLIFFTLLTDSVVFSEYLYLYQLHILILVIVFLPYLVQKSITGNTNATKTLFSFLILAFGIINDVLHSLGLIQTAFISPFSLIAFIITLASIISLSNAKAHQKAEHLSSKLSQEVENQTAKLNRIQSLSQKVQNTSDMENMRQTLGRVLHNEFQIPMFILYSVNNIKGELEFHSLWSTYNYPDYVIDTLKKNNISLKQSVQSVHGKVVQKKRPLYLNRLPDANLGKAEEQIKLTLNMTSLYVLPLKMDDEVFAVFSMTDVIDEISEQYSSIKHLKKAERAEIELLGQYVSGVFYQSLQKEQIKKAKDEAAQAQAAASRAKNEAAINQLAAHLAHEVNNPLNYIATGKTMQNDSFAKYHEMILGVLSGDDEETKDFKAELDNLQKKFEQGMKQTNEGQDRIAKVVAEIRAITGVDGLNFSTFDIVPIINEELVYSLHRNKIKIKEQAIKVTGTDNPIEVLSNSHILARSIRTVISNCIHFAREHKANEGELYIDCKIADRLLLIDIGNNSFSIKTTELEDLFDLEKSQSYGTEQIGLAMIKELLLKVNSNLLLADHGRESGKVVFQLQVPLES